MEQDLFEHESFNGDEDNCHELSETPVQDHASGDSADETERETNVTPSFKPKKKKRIKNSNFLKSDHPVVVVSGLDPVNPAKPLIDFINEHQVTWKKVRVEYDKVTRLGIGRAVIYCPSTSDVGDILEVLRETKWEATAGDEFIIKLSNLPPETEYKDVAKAVGKFARITSLYLNKTKKPPRVCKGSARVGIVCSGKEHFQDFLLRLHSTTSTIHGHAIKAVDSTIYPSDSALVFTGFDDQVSYSCVRRMASREGIVKACLLSQEEGCRARAYVCYSSKVRANKALQYLKTHPFLASTLKVEHSVTVYQDIAQGEPTLAPLMQEFNATPYLESKMGLLPKLITIDGITEKGKWRVIGSVEDNCRLWSTMVPPPLPRCPSPDLSIQTHPSFSKPLSPFRRLIRDGDWVFVEFSGPCGDAEKYFYDALKGLAEVACVGVVRDRFSFELTGIALVGIKDPPPDAFIMGKLAIAETGTITPIPVDAYLDFVYFTRNALGKLNHALDFTGGSVARVGIAAGDTTQVTVEPYDRVQELDAENGEGAVCEVTIEGATRDTELSDILWNDNTDVWLMGNEEPSYNIRAWTRVWGSSPGILLCSVPPPMPGSPVLLTLGPPLSDDTTRWWHPSSPRLPEGWPDVISVRLILSSFPMFLQTNIERILLQWLSPYAECSEVTFIVSTDAPLFTAFFDLRCPTLRSFVALLISINADEFSSCILKLRVCLPQRRNCM